jgi:hypothetical protein
MAWMKLQYMDEIISIDEFDHLKLLHLAMSIKLKYRDADQFHP